MRASKAILLSASATVLVFTLAHAGSPAFGQSSLDDVHVTPLLEQKPANPLDQIDPLLNTHAQPIKKDVDLVLVPVTITDATGRLVTGLEQGNFQVFDGKQQQEIRHFSSEDAPVSLGILLDLSGSMVDKLERAKEAVVEFCRTANPQDEFFLISFSDTPRLVVDFTSRVEDIQSTLLTAATKGRTSLLDAIYMGMNKMQQARHAKKALLIISDGGDNRSRYTQNEIKSLVREGDVMIYAVGTYDRNFQTAEEQLGPELLSDIAQATGGRAFTLDNPNYLPSVAEHIGMELRNQYVIGYRPEQAPHDGKWHKIRVKMSIPKGWPFLQVNAKTGYYASTQ